ncbi:MAG: NAD(P)-dependent oxidoreductase [Ruminococcus sp.]|nr:NAD(P)-dependent oxidoreductase [Ruminococcus sp.]MDE6784564.1 NAD(P)-dependent oxidoreductase [Ruminococcus sp.]
MKTVLVTGGCGLIGQHICSGLLKKGFAVVAADVEECMYNTGKKNYSFVQVKPSDKNAYAEIFENYKINILIHAANTVDNDLGPIVNDKEVSESRSCDKFIYHYAMTSEGFEKVILISTDKVYDFPKTREPIREDADLKATSNYAIMKYESEKALVSEMRNHKNIIVCIARIPPVYTLNFVDNLMSKITNPKDGTKFVSGEGTYGFQFCCVHNLVDFVLCFVKNADDMQYAGIYNVCDKHLITAAEIISFMRENHSLGAVLQKSGGGAISKIKGILGRNKNNELITNYRYLDMNKLENNNMLDSTKSRKIFNPRWDIHNTK